VNAQTSCFIKSLAVSQLGSEVHHSIAGKFLGEHDLSVLGFLDNSLLEFIAGNITASSLGFDDLEHNGVLTKIFVSQPP